MNPRPFPYIPGCCDRDARGRLPAPPYNPTDYWATRKWVSAFLGRVSAEVAVLRDRIDAVDEKTHPLSDCAPFSLARNEDLYYALSVIIPRLGGTATLGG